jgi:hypothetical protein
MPQEPLARRGRRERKGLSERRVRKAQRGRRVLKASWVLRDLGVPWVRKVLRAQPAPQDRRDPPAFKVLQGQSVRREQPVLPARRELRVLRV